MSEKVTDIKLGERESALVFKPDGSLQLFLNCDPEVKEKLNMNEILAVALATLLKNKEFTTKTINLFLEIRDSVAKEIIDSANKETRENKAKVEDE